MNSSSFKFSVPATIATVVAVVLAACNIHLLGELREARKSAAATSAGEADAAKTAEVMAIATNAASQAADAAIAAAKVAPLRAVAAEWNTYAGKVNVSFSDGYWFRAPETGEPFSFDPPVKNTRWEQLYYYCDDNGIAIRGDFEPDTLYTLTLNPGWTSGDKSLDKAVRLSFRSGPAKPKFSLAASGKYYPASREYLRLPYTAGGVTNIGVTVFRVYDNDATLFGMDRDTQQNNTRKVAEGNIPISGADIIRATRKNGFIDLGAILKNPEPGIYFVQIETKPETERENNWDEFDGYRCTSHESMLALTDLAVQFARPEGNGRGRAAAFVTSFGTGLPVAGAEVTALTAKHQVAGKGVTDETGLAMLDLAFDEGDTVQIVTAAADGDFAALNINQPANVTHDSSFFYSNGFKEMRALVFSERDLCRPGEKFESALFARSSLQDGAIALAGAPAELVLTDPAGEVAGRQRVTTDEFGFARAEWTVPVTASLGTWAVSCKIGGKEAGFLLMRVATYRPDRLKVEMRPAIHEAVGLSTPVSVVGSAKYYFGAPLSDGYGKLSAYVGLAESPRRWEGWHVGTPQILGDSTTWEGRIDIGENGSFSITYPGPSGNAVTNAFHPVRAALVGQAQEPGGNAISVNDVVVFHPTPDYVAIREANDEASSFDFAIFPAIADATPTNGAPMDIEVSLTRHYWERHLEKDGSGQLKVKWDNKHEKVDSLSRKLTVPAGEAGSWTGRLDYAEADLAEGHYTMEATCGDSRKTSFEFWHWVGEAGARSSSLNSLAIDAGAPSYVPGDTATLAFRSPFDGTACVVAGAGGIDSAFSASVTQGVNKVEVKIPETVLTAKYHASVTLVSDESRESPRLFGLAGLAIDNTRSHRLETSIAVADAVRPGDTVPVTVTLKDGSGNPAAGLVRLSAIDEGVAVLTDFHVEDAYTYFFKLQFDAPFSNYDYFGSIFPDLRILPDGTFGGDGVMSANKFASALKEKETVRIVMPPVKVDASGSATVDVRIPDHLGALRFMAVSASEKAAGSCEDTIVVRDVVSVLPTAPRFAVSGDRFTLTAQVFNHDAEEGDWNLAIDLPDGLSAADAGKSVKLAGRLAKGQSKAVAVDVAIDKTAIGALDIPFALTLGGEKARALATVNVRPPNPAETRIEYIAITNGAASIAPDATAWIGPAKSSVTLHASPAFAIADSLSWLGKYPYGCLEQTVAAAFPFVVAADMEKIGVLDAADRAAAEVKVKLAYAEILGMRVGDGGFAMWPWQKDTWRYGSLFANHFMFEAERAGIITMPDAFRKIQRNWLRNVAADASPENREDSAYAAYILSVANDLVFATAARNILGEGRVDFPSFLAAAALIRGGFASEGVAAFDRAVAARVWENGDSWNSIRHPGMALFVACKTGHGDIAALTPAALRLNSMLRANGTAWGTTRDNAWATLGLAPFAARVGAGFGTGTFAVGDAVLEKFDASSKPVKFTRDTAVPVAINADGTLFASVATTGTPVAPSTNAGPVSITRRYFDSNGDEVSSVKAGDLVTAIVEIRTPRLIEDAVVADMIPGGFEIEDASFATRSTAGAYAPRNGAPMPSGFAEIRNDRWIWYGDIGTPDKDGRAQTLVYHLRACVPGTYAVPAAMVEAMYEPDLCGHVPAAGRIEVR